MKCSLCNENAVFSSPRYCKKHFIYYFEDKVKNTIKKYGLFKKTDKILVAVSGGKDSSSLLYLLNKLRYNVSGLAIDEGISGYRDKTLEGLKKMCKKNSTPLKIVSFNEKFNKTLDEIIKKGKDRPCSVCGILRRNLLNTYSKSFDALATGHNLDDEAQAIIMNLAKGNVSLLERTGPVSGVALSEKFTKRVKPFYLCSEKEIMTYSLLIGLNIEFNECPYVDISFRLRFRDLLNEIELEKPGTKRKIIYWFLKYKKNIKNKKGEPSFCIKCGEPSAKKICNTCLYLEKISQYK